MMNKVIKCPQWLIAGLEFRSIWLDGIIKVVEVDASLNILKVEMSTEESFREDTWDLDVTILQFKHGEYERIRKNNQYKN